MESNDPFWESRDIKMYIVQVLVNGILLGGIYAGIGLGMSLILGIVKLTNLAHGEFIIMGAFLSAILTSALGIDPLLTLFVSVPTMFFFGYALQRVLVNHGMKRGAEPALLVTFGISIILKDGMLMLFTPDARHVATSYSNSVVTIAGIDISFLNIILLIVCAVFIFVLRTFLEKTDIGRAIRATADDTEAAQLSGINVAHTFAIAMGIATAASAVAGTCVSMKWTFYPTSGGEYLLIAFVVVVISGLGDIRGILLAGVMFGLMQVIGGASYGRLISYIFLIVLLVFNPREIFGRMLRDKRARNLSKREVKADE